MRNAWDVYELLLDKANSISIIEELIIGLTWTYCRTNAAGTGLAMSATIPDRTLNWSGTLKGQSARKIAEWVKSWEPHQASVGMATLNALLNQNAAIRDQADVLPGTGPGNLRVFEYFLPKLKGQKVVVVGRYPGLDRFNTQCDLTILERMQGGDRDLPDSACEYVLPQADWVFLTATSLINKTFPRLVELSRDATVVLMGPTVPWVEELAEYGVDFLAGVRLTDEAALRQTVMEGGGTRLFDTGVEYCVVDIAHGTMQQHKDKIATLYMQREELKDKMQRWYNETSGRRFPEYVQLENIDRELSHLDKQYKRMWDARQAK